MANDDLGREMRDLLEREHTALLNGRLDDIGRLAAEKQRLEAVLASHRDRTQIPRLAGLRDMALRNADLMNAVHRGLKAAQARLAQIRDGGPRFDTYDRLGQRRTLGTGLSTLERRA